MSRSVEGVTFGHETAHTEGFNPPKEGDEVSIGDI